MKIAIYNTKGWAGKTPIAANIALDRDYAVWTNEPYHVYSSLIPEKRLLSVGLNDAFPELPSEIDIVFDLAGSISNTSQSIVSAIKQADLVIVPIYNELKAITAGLNTVAEVLRLNQNAIIVATKLQRKKWDRFKAWDKVGDYCNIASAVQQHYPKIPVLPLKYSTVFDAIFEQECSIAQLIQKSWLNKYHYREVQEQFNAIYSVINNYAK